MFRPTVERLEQREVCTVSLAGPMMPTIVAMDPLCRVSQVLAHVEHNQLGQLSPDAQGSNVADFNGDMFNPCAHRQLAQGVVSANAINAYFCLPEVGDEIHRWNNIAERTESVNHNESITIDGNVGNSNGIIAVLIGL